MKKTTEMKIHCSYLSYDGFNIKNNTYLWAFIKYPHFRIGQKESPDPLNLISIMKLDIY